MGYFDAVARSFAMDYFWHAYRLWVTLERWHASAFWVARLLWRLKLPAQRLKGGVVLIAADGEFAQILGFVEFRMAMMIAFRTAGNNISWSCLASRV